MWPPFVIIACARLMNNSQMRSLLIIGFLLPWQIMQGQELVFDRSFKVTGIDSTIGQDRIVELSDSMLVDWSIIRGETFTVNDNRSKLTGPVTKLNARINEGLAAVEVDMGPYRYGPHLMSRLEQPLRLEWIEVMVTLIPEQDILPEYVQIWFGYYTDSISALKWSLPPDTTYVSNTPQEAVPMPSFRIVGRDTLRKGVRTTIIQKERIFSEVFGATEFLTINTCNPNPYFVAKVFIERVEIRKVQGPPARTDTEFLREPFVPTYYTAFPRIEKGPKKKGDLICNGGFDMKLFEVDAYGIWDNYVFASETDIPGWHSLAETERGLAYVLYDTSIVKPVACRAFTLFPEHYKHYEECKVLSPYSGNGSYAYQTASRSEPWKGSPSMFVSALSKPMIAGRSYKVEMMIRVDEEVKDFAGVDLHFFDHIDALNDEINKWDMDHLKKEYEASQSFPDEYGVYWIGDQAEAKGKWMKVSKVIKPKRTFYIVSIGMWHNSSYENEAHPFQWCAIDDLSITEIQE